MKLEVNEWLINAKKSDENCFRLKALEYFNVGITFCSFFFFFFFYLCLFVPGYLHIYLHHFFSRINAEF